MCVAVRNQEQEGDRGMPSRNIDGVVLLHQLVMIMAVTIMVVTGKMNQRARASGMRVG